MGGRVSLEVPPDACACVCNVCGGCMHMLRSARALARVLLRCIHGREQRARCQPRRLVLPHTLFTARLFLWRPTRLFLRCHPPLLPPHEPPPHPLHLTLRILLAARPSPPPCWMTSATPCRPVCGRRIHGVADRNACNACGRATPVGPVAAHSDCSCRRLQWRHERRAYSPRATCRSMLAT